MTANEYDGPRDPAAGARTAQVADAHRIWHWLRDRTGQAFTSADIASCLGITRGFSSRLAVARSLALDHDEIITNAEPVGRLWVIRHLMPGAENGLAIRSMLIRDNVLAGYIEKQARQNGWGAANFADPLHREFAALKAEWHMSFLSMNVRFDRLRQAVLGDS